MRPDGSEAVAVTVSARPSRVGRGVPLVHDHRDRVAEVLESARASLTDVALPGHADVLDFPSARHALDEAWAQVLAAATASVDQQALVGLLDEIKRTAELLELEWLRHRDATFGRVRDALSMLRDSDSTPELVERAAAAACAIGFDRAIVSRIEDSSWIPEKVSVERDPRWAEEILQAGREHTQLLDRTLVETEMVRRRVGILVHDVQARPAVHRPIADASRSRSYAAVPLIVNGGVIGFVHVDCYYQQRDLDEFDRGVLGVFAEGLGQALGRTTMIDRLAMIRVGFDQVAGALATAKDERVQLAVPGSQGLAPLISGFVANQRGSAVHEDRFPISTEGSTLTRREVEVLRLMAAGDTNGRIARRLVISEGTVKSHVKHILRKLGAANRAEAVSRWLGMGRGAPGGNGAGAGPKGRDG